MIDPKEHPMLLAEPPLNTQQQREKSGLCILLFDTDLTLESGTDFLLCILFLTGLLS